MAGLGKAGYGKGLMACNEFGCGRARLGLAGQGAAWYGMGTMSTQRTAATKDG